MGRGVVFPCDRPKTTRVPVLQFSEEEIDETQPISRLRRPLPRGLRVLREGARRSDCLYPDDWRITNGIEHAGGGTWPCDARDLARRRSGVAGSRRASRPILEARRILRGPPFR